MSEFRGVKYGGQKLDVCDQAAREMVCEENVDVFSESVAYEAENLCIYNNALYKFTKDKEAGPWDPEAVVKTSLIAEINDILRRLGGYTFYSPPLTSEGYEALGEYENMTFYPTIKDADTASLNMTSSQADSQISNMLPSYSTNSIPVVGQPEADTSQEPEGELNDAVDLREDSDGN